MIAYITKCFGESLRRKEKIFDEFYNLKSKEAQDIYLAVLLKVKEFFSHITVKLKEEEKCQIQSGKLITTTK
jgi:hypothetical protein